MTRSESLDYIGIDYDIEGYEVPDESMTSYSGMINLVSKIYDGFESRICENCKHYSNDFVCSEIPQHDTDILDSDGRSVPSAEFIPMDGFGCNRFERRENAK